MAGLKENFDSLRKNIKEYISTYKDLLTIKVIKGASTVVSGIVVGVLAFLLLIFFLMFLGLGLGWWIGGLLNSIAAGMFIVAVIYLLLIVLIVTVGRKWILNLIRKILIKKVYE